MGGGSGPDSGVSTRGQEGPPLLQLHTCPLGAQSQSQCADPQARGTSRCTVLGSGLLDASHDPSLEPCCGASRPRPCWTASCPLHGSPGPSPPLRLGGKPLHGPLPGPPCPSLTEPQRPSLPLRRTPGQPQRMSTEGPLPLPCSGGLLQGWDPWPGVSPAPQQARSPGSHGDILSVAGDSRGLAGGLGTWAPCWP